jgi:hypothetical protein
VGKGEADRWAPLGGDRGEGGRWEAGWRAERLGGPRDKETR